jgi:hypothetical protein
MTAMRGLSVGVLALLAGCHTGERADRDDGAGLEDERKVFGPMAQEEVKDFVREKRSDGWEVIGYEPASLPEDVMISSTELDVPSKAKRSVWSYDIPKTMDSGVDPPRKATVPPYLEEGVKAHRQKYLVIMRRWL